MHDNRFVLIVITVCILAAGCLKKDLNLSIRFDKIHGLKTEDRVVFDDNIIGRVTRVSYTSQGTYLVDIAIDTDFKNTATEHSEFYILDDPLEMRRKAVEVTIGKPGGNLLADGAVVQGTDKRSGFFGDLKKSIQKGVDDLKQGLGNGMDEFNRDFEAFTDELRRVPQGEDFRQLQKEMNRLGREMKKSGEAAREKFRNELLPQLRSEMEALRKKLRELGREDELKQLDNGMEELNRI